MLPIVLSWFSLVTIQFFFIWIKQFFFYKHLDLEKKEYFLGAYVLLLLTAAGNFWVPIIILFYTILVSLATRYFMAYMNIVPDKNLNQIFTILVSGIAIFSTTVSLVSVLLYWVFYFLYQRYKKKGGFKQYDKEIVFVSYLVPMILLFIIG